MNGRIDCSESNKIRISNTITRSSNPFVRCLTEKNNKLYLEQPFYVASYPPQTIIVDFDSLSFINIKILG